MAPTRRLAAIGRNVLGSTTALRCTPSSVGRSASALEVARHLRGVLRTHDGTGAVDHELGNLLGDRVCPRGEQHVLRIDLHVSVHDFDYLKVRMTQHAAGVQRDAIFASGVFSP
jgi:hypothetical protein